MTMPDELSSLIKEGNFNPSQVQVIENGQNVMRPDVMQFLMTAAIASQAVKVRKYFDDRESVGWTQSFAIIVTPVVTKIEPDSLGQSFFVVNDGVPAPAPAVIVSVEVNKRFASATLLNRGDSIFIDFETHKLKRLFLYTAAGNSPTRILIKG